jgi:DNA-binding beta-propeller fold protein YncE
MAIDCFPSPSTYLAIATTNTSVLPHPQSNGATMRLFASFLLTCFILSATALAAPQHLLYMTSPDGAQSGGSGDGLLIFDVDNGHKFLRRITIPSFHEGIRGVCASAVNHRIFISTSKKRMICMDLETDKVLWEKVYDTGCDRMSITPDGKRLYVPSGWWAPETLWLVLSADDGAEITRIPVKAPGHNTLISLDGTRAYLASNSHLVAVDTSDNRILYDLSHISGDNFPFTINANHSFGYICLGKQIGFQIVDLNEGKLLKEVVIDGPPAKRRTHGVGLTPDEKEIWLSDQAGNAIFIFDNTVDSPKQVERLPVSKGGHGWIAFSLDGRYAYCSSVEVFDTKSRKVVATFKDENGQPFSSSKYVEVVFEGQKVTAVGDQFGVGRAKR